MRKELVGAGAAFGLVMVGTHLGLTGLLGAHPFWAVKVGYIGALVGLVLAVGFWWMRVGFGLKLTLAAGLLILAAGVAALGKARFAASYAEDALAGKMWFFGWIGIVVAVFLTLFVGIGLRPAARR